VLPHPPLGEARYAVREDRGAALEVGAACAAGRDLLGPVPLGPGAAWRGAADLGHGDADGDDGGGREHPDRHGRAYLPHRRVDTGDEYFYSADGELLVVPQEGRLRFCTELGIIDLEPKEVAILPRGLVYRVEVLEGPCRGFVCENYGVPFQLPHRGPIGANCLANPRDFKTPVAAFEDREAPSTVTLKWCGQFHRTRIGHSPLDVVAWHGNYAPCKYDLRAYAPVGAILFDHPDPSIFTVLTAPSGLEGTANIDFVLFRERWLVAEHSFRPPWYHKNVMSELMGNIYGIYDAKPKGFVPGGMSLHNCMLPHGPDRQAFEGASNAELKPEKLDETMSFMFETRFPQHLTEWAAKSAPLQDDYIECWASLDKKFDGTPGVK
jgi:homogentisate 1,2-dioxygenase